MRILKRKPDCADLKLSDREGQNRVPKLSHKECHELLDDIRQRIARSIGEIKISKQRRIVEAQIHKGNPEQDIEMNLTGDRIELEKSELALLQEQLESTWERIPEKIRPIYQTAVDAMRACIQKQLKPANISKRTKVSDNTTGELETE